MAFNPMMIMQIKSKVEGFNARHPKLKLFMADAIGRMDTDDVFEISLTKAEPDGSRIRTNFKVTPEDKELLSELVNMIGNK